MKVSRAGEGEGLRPGQGPLMTVDGTVRLCPPYNDEPQSLRGPGASVPALGVRKGKCGAPDVGRACEDGGSAAT